jgi:hypothetical protein
MFSSADSKFAGYCFLDVFSLKVDLKALPSVPFGVSSPGIANARGHALIFALLTLARSVGRFRL